MEAAEQEEMPMDGSAVVALDKAWAAAVEASWFAPSASTAARQRKQALPPVAKALPPAAGAKMEVRQPGRSGANNASPHKVTLPTAPELVMPTLPPPLRLRSPRPKPRPVVLAELRPSTTATCAGMNATAVGPSSRRRPFSEDAVRSYLQHARQGASPVPEEAPQPPGSPTSSRAGSHRSRRPESLEGRPPLRSDSGTGSTSSRALQSSTPLAAGATGGTRRRSGSEGPTPSPRRPVTADMVPGTPGGPLQAASPRHHGAAGVAPPQTSPAMGRRSSSGPSARRSLSGLAPSQSSRPTLPSPRGTPAAPRASTAGGIGPGRRREGGSIAKAQTPAVPALSLATWAPPGSSSSSRGGGTSGTPGAAEEAGQEKRPRSERLRRLELRQTGKAAEIRNQRQRELRRRQFAALPPGEVEALKAIFERFDLDRSGYLDHFEVMACLREFGMSGSTPQEKREIFDICLEATPAEALPDTVIAVQKEGSDVMVNLTELALTVVPRVRQRLQELQGDELLKEFFKYDLDNSGKLSKREIAELARGMGLDTRMLQMPAGDEELDFPSFQEMVTRARERARRVVRDRERQVQRVAGLDEATFQRFREDLVALHDLFLRCSAKDDKGRLDQNDTLLLLREFGVKPKTLHEKHRMEHIVQHSDTDKSSTFTFRELLNAMHEIRTFFLERRSEDQMLRFLKHDREKCGQTATTEIATLLADLGYVPTNKKEQEEIAHLITTVDMDGSGHVTFDEFQALCQRVDEKLNSFRFEEEVEHAMQLDFTEKQMRDLRWVFDTLDTDGSNKLDANEVRQGLIMMRKHVSTESFESAFKQLDADANGELCFKEFLSFMKLMRDSEGVSEDATSRLAGRPVDLDARTLRKTLELFRLAKHYVHSLPHHELVAIFCNCFTIAPMCNLMETLGVRTGGELYEAARRRDAEMRALQTGS